METVIRAAVVFLALWAITRVVGRSTLGELSSFELIVFVTMGDLVQQAVTGQDSSVTGAVLAVGTMAALTIILAWFNARSRKLHAVVTGRPVVVVSDGAADHDTLRRERLAYDDLLGAARQQGIEDLRSVRLAVLEPNGKVSFFAGESPASGAPDGTDAG
ncbi:DUF421 domain-containing protein [Sanguibacter sp. HDW7]|uniref:DUF421 domain-containing protein n=1 Tax=Sanguibacter sp. HDW7 TaxID=2714931 RepID=UPI00140E60DE|nr:YetF domain-containing protein [Sanguibacter sp. HDW7]QIK82287.1 DUF421 domain-containing protein [Sanguibacter sp. HDW7]